MAMFLFGKKSYFVGVVLMAFFWIAFDGVSFRKKNIFVGLFCKETRYVNYELKSWCAGYNLSRLMACAMRVTFLVGGSMYVSLLIILVIIVLQRVSSLGC